MAMRNVAKFLFGLARIMFRALNDDLTRPTIDRIIGGAGPFDFSGATNPAAVPLKFKFDSGVEVSVNVVMNAGVSDIAAVTVDELVTRAGLALAAQELTASKEVATGRFKLAYNGTDDPKFIQVYGEFAQLAKIGQGIGQQFIKSNTMKSFAVTPTMQEDQTFNTEPANGAVIEVIVEGYKKGFTGTLIDTAEDFKLMQLIEGGVIDENGRYIDPCENNDKTYFEIFVFNPVYGEGSNLEENIQEWQQIEFQKCTGRVGEETFEKNFRSKTYNVVGTNYEDESGARTGAKISDPLTLAEWEALDFDNL